MEPRGGDQDFVSPQEIREIFGFGETKTYRILREQLPTYRIGRSVFVKRRDLERWIEQNRREPKGLSA